MLLTLTGHSFRYECENLCRLFFPYSPVRVEEKPESRPELEALPEGEPWAFTRAFQEPSGQWIYQIRAWDGQARAEGQSSAPQLAEYPMTDLLYSVLSGLTGIQPAWGMLTGVHPVKLLRQHTERLGMEAGAKDFQAKWHVSPARTKLAGQVLSAQREAVEALRPGDFSLYVGIPFCPTRCAYCSFISQDMANAAKLVEPYLSCLRLELERTAAITAGLGMRPVSVYVGGGTPTTLSAGQLEELCGWIRRLFDLSSCTEFTVEAGRPDTITREKLAVLRDSGVTRVSVNPQTMMPQVLKNIGRSHSPQQVEEAFALAREAGFRDVNADLIVGLPGDDLEGFSYSLGKVLDLGPTNVTVHSLALKRSSALVTEDGDLSSHKKRAQAARMMDLSIRTLGEAGFIPYYLYRQTRMAGNLENTGWTLPGSVCRYNVYTMDESGTVIACGAGGVTKLKDPYSDALQRVFNFKLPLEYISRHGEILTRKDGMGAVLADLLKQS